MSRLHLAIAINLRKQLNEQANPGQVLHDQLVALWTNQDIDGALRLCEGAYRLSLEVSNSYGQGVSLFYIALGWFLKGEIYWGRAVAICDESARRFYTAANVDSEGTARYTQGIILELVSRWQSNRWQDALAAYLEACRLYDEAKSALFAHADRRYKASALQMNRRRNFAYRHRSPKPISTPLVIPPPPVPASPKHLLPLDEYAQSDPTLFQIPRIFFVGIFIFLLAGSLIFIMILTSSDSAIGLACLTGFLIAFFGPLVSLSIIFTVAKQLYCKIPENCVAVFQYRHGQLGKTQNSDRAVWVFPLIERVRAIVPLYRLSFVINGLELVTTAPIHVFANLRGTYQVGNAIRLVFCLRGIVRKRFLGVPCPLSCSELTTEAEKQIRDILSQVIGHVLAGKSVAQILNQKTQIHHEIRLEAKKAATHLGIAIYNDLQIDLHVG